MALAEKFCEDCWRSFVPLKSGQRRCNTCLSAILKPDTQRCSDCGRKFVAGGNAERCKNCRELAALDSRAERLKEGSSKIFSEIECDFCGKLFTPNAPRQKQCDECRHDEKRCACGNRISGREKWGDEWGGQCDRAEARAAALIIAMSTRTSR